MVSVDNFHIGVSLWNMWPLTSTNHVTRWQQMQTADSVLSGSLFQIWTDCKCVTVSVLFCATFTPLSLQISVLCSAPLAVRHCSLSPNCAGVWQKPRQAEHQTELTGCWRLHSHRAWIKSSWQVLLLHFSADIRVPTWHGGHVSCRPLLALSYSLYVFHCARPCPRFHKRKVSRDQRPWTHTLEQCFCIHTESMVLVHMNKTTKEMEFR